MPKSEGVILHLSPHCAVPTAIVPVEFASSKVARSALDAQTRASSSDLDASDPFPGGDQGRRGEGPLRFRLVVGPNASTTRGMHMSELQTIHIPAREGKLLAVC